MFAWVWSTALGLGKPNYSPRPWGCALSVLLTERFVATWLPYGRQSTTPTDLPTTPTPHGYTRPSDPTYLSQHTELLTPGSLPSSWHQQMPVHATPGLQSYSLK